jgi:hypothetical protein
MSNNDFSRLYKTWPNARLLEIIDNPQQFQPIAVEAAQRELESRQLSDEQLDDERTLHAERQQAFEIETRRTMVVTDKLKAFALSIINILNPVSNEDAVEKKRKLISLFLGTLFLYHLYASFGLIELVVEGGLAVLDFGGAYYLIFFFTALSAAVLLWDKKKIGWILATFYFAYSAMISILLFRYSIIWYLEGGVTGGLADTIFSSGSPGSHVGGFLVFGASTWTMTKENFRGAYHVDKQTMIITIASGMALPLLERLVYSL